jgi:hypothetical protein
MATNPDASTGIHSAVPHRYVHAYLVAIKSFLQYYNDISVFVHDDGSLRPDDKTLIGKHIHGIQIIDRTVADARFAENVQNPLLLKVRSSYTSYLKLFDPTLFSEGKKIIILDTDTIFLRRPDLVIDWVASGRSPWYHCAPRGKMKMKEQENIRYSRLQDVHIQTLIVDHIDSINQQLGKTYRIEQGFCSGFIGYDFDTVRFDELAALFETLYSHLGDRIFRWGAEQTSHGMILCGAGAVPLPLEEYFVFTQNNAQQARDGTFIHFVGENRFFHLIYPRLASVVLDGLLGKPKQEITVA